MLKKAIKDKRVTVGVVGLGYVGMPTTLALTQAGIRVIGIDIDKARVRRLNGSHDSRRFTATANWTEIKKCKVILIAVPTPLTKNKAPDVSAIESAAKNIAKYLSKDSLVILESTTYPGTTEELVKPILEKPGRVSGKDFYLAYAPERIDPGNKFPFNDIPKVVGGMDKKSTDLAATFYLTFLKNVHKVSSPRAAEFTKLLENIFRLVNVSAINELNLLADKMGIDIWEAIEAAKTKPYGYMPFYPGPGIGGHCIGVDPFYLSWKAKEYGFFARFIELAGEINELMPHHVVTKVIWALNCIKKSLRGSKILVLGVAYKKDIDDARESPAIPIIKDLLRKGADVSYHDPFVPQIKIGNHQFKSAPLSKPLLKNADCILILTDHSTLDYSTVTKSAKLIVDTRHTIKEKMPNVIHL
ncbi:MAG: nucleotide sugar dehydrogenase [Candidatus Colwellbacteria bacterium]|nr:nucleotide sugar dehydrogenase [Candidatus Colwellbacteria bacterium]